MEDIKTDVFSEFEELDTLDNTSDYTLNNFQDLIDEARIQKEKTKAPLEEVLNTTNDISNFQDELLDKLDAMIQKPVTVDNVIVEKDEAMMKAFIYTFMVCFVLLMICWGIYLYIITR